MKRPFSMMSVAAAVLAVAAAVIAVSRQAGAVMPDEVLADPALEARARGLSQELRCLVCQNQSIDDSAAPLARDLRLLVRDRLRHGDSDTQVIDYLVARYGNYVLLKPPLQSDTLLLWMGPGIILAAGLVVLAAYTRSRRDFLDRPAPPLTDDERRQLASLAGDPRR